jgi:uncharacterized protein DUF6152
MSDSASEQRKNSTLTRRFAPPSLSGRGIVLKSFPLPLGEGGVKRRVRVEFRHLFICAFLGLLTAAFGHHSAARYDLSKTVVIQGTVTEVLWQNPHVILVMNDTKGQEQAFEAPSPTYIVNSGWMKDTIKPGDKVTVKGNPAKNGELPMYLVTVTLPNGKEYSPKNPERP